MTRRTYSKSPATDCAEVVVRFSKEGRICKVKDYATLAGLTIDGARGRLDAAVSQGLLVMRKIKIGLGSAQSHYVAKGYEDLFLQLTDKSRKASEEELRAHKHRFATMQLRVQA